MATKYGWANSEWMEVQIHKGQASLPHQCDDWEIGDADDVRAMIKDLQEALVKLEADDGAV